MRLSDDRWIIVRFDCALCRRRGQYRPARLAAQVGPEPEREAVRQRIAYDGPRMRPDRKSRKYVAKCRVRFTGLERRGWPPPDVPPAMVRLRMVSQDEEQDDSDWSDPARRRR